jgi:hypothetical protein
MSQARFWEESETIMSPDSTGQHRPDGQNPIAMRASRKNTAQAWLETPTVLEL